MSEDPHVLLTVPGCGSQARVPANPIRLVHEPLGTRTDPLTHTEIYQYDANGNLTQVTDRKSQVTTFTYDGLNRRTQTQFHDAATIAYTLDAGNRITQLVDSVMGTITRSYDGLDRLTSETTPKGTVSYTYDAAGRRATMTVAGQPLVTYTFDIADRLAQVVRGTSTVGFSYDDANRRTSLTLPNGVVMESGHDAASRLTGLTYRLGATPLGALTYAYDLTGTGSSSARAGRGPPYRPPWPQPPTTPPIA